MRCNDNNCKLLLQDLSCEILQVSYIITVRIYDSVLYSAVWLIYCTENSKKTCQLLKDYFKEIILIFNSGSRSIHSSEDEKDSKQDRELILLSKVPSHTYKGKEKVTRHYRGMTSSKINKHHYCAKTRTITIAHHSWRKAERIQIQGIINGFYCKTIYSGIIWR